MIIQETINSLEKNYHEYIKDLKIKDVRAGVFLTAIKLSDGNVGISSTIPAPDPRIHCLKENRDFGEFTPNQIVGKRVIDLLKTQKKNALMDSLKVAALNAISSKIIENSSYKILTKTDPIDLIDLNSSRTIALIGAFPSYIQKISLTKNKLFVLEQNEKALNEDFRRFYVPAEQYTSILPDSDIIIITGSTLVNNTFENLMENIRKESILIVTGPSSSFIPDILFENGVKIIGSVRITDPDIVLKVVSEGGAGYHLFRYCAEKICILQK